MIHSASVARFSLHDGEVLSEQRRACKIMGQLYVGGLVSRKAATNSYPTGLPSLPVASILPLPHDNVP